jgi:NADH:ubiquinone oxidoreductase subunit 6 (subunit J)
MEYLLLVTGIIVCAVMAIRAARLLASALWLAGVSVITALALYLIGAREVAVIELSVGAGLVTVLFVFAITIAGEDAMHSRPLIPRPLAWLLVVIAFTLLGFLIFPADENRASYAEATFTIVFWQERALDVLVQIALIFAGVLGVLGLLAEPKVHTIPSLELPAEKNIEPEPVSSTPPLTEEEFV